MLPVASSAAAAAAPSGGAGSASNNSTSEPPQPPPNNPILTAYEGWYHSTPFVTRSILSIQAISYLFSWLINHPEFALANIPHFILSPRYEIYRLILSPLVNTSFISLIVAYLSFNEPGKRLEYSLGSTRFAALCLSIGTITNVAFFTSSVVMFYIQGGGSDQGHVLLSSASGIWLVLFGIIAMECVQAPAGTQRKLFLWHVPVLYYPVALLLFFAFISASFSLAYCLSMAVGYLYGFGYLERIQFSHGKAAAWEDHGSNSSSNSSSSSFNWAGYLTRRDGWVSCHAATGSDAWMESASSMGGGGGGLVRD
jgi:membrane associated rhomboid family serine protease